MNVELYISMLVTSLVGISVSISMNRYIHNLNQRIMNLETVIKILRKEDT